MHSAVTHVLIDYHDNFISPCVATIVYPTHLPDNQAVDAIPHCRILRCIPNVIQRQYGHTGGGCLVPAEAMTTVVVVRPFTTPQLPPQVATVIQKNLSPKVAAHVHRFKHIRNGLKVSMFLLMVQAVLSAVASQMNGIGVKVARLRLCTEDSLIRQTAQIPRLVTKRYASCHHRRT